MANGNEDGGGAGSGLGIGLLAAGIGFAVSGGIGSVTGMREPDAGAGGNGDAGVQRTCSDHVAAAQAFAQGSTCSGDSVELMCPMGDLIYRAQNSCEANFLRSKGWIVVERDSTDENGTVTEDPTFQAYELRIFSDSEVGVDYRLHMGPRPVALRPPDVDERHAAEPDGNDTVRQLPDGTWLVEGRVGSSDGTTYADSYQWTTVDTHRYGVLGWETNIGDYRLELNGDALDAGTLPMITV